MKKIFTKTLLATAVIAICSPAMAGDLTVTKGTYSVEGLSQLASTATLYSNNITYELAADYAVGDKITFSFSDSISPSHSFPLSPSTSLAGFELTRSSSEAANPATYTVTTVPSSTIGVVVDIGGIVISASAVAEAPFVLTVSSETAAGDLLDDTGTLTATIAELVSQFGTLTTPKVFSNVIDNSIGNDSTSFTSASEDTLTWAATNLTTLNQAVSISSTQVIIQGEPGKMNGLKFASSAGTTSFDQAAATLTITYAGAMEEDTITITPKVGDDAVELSAQAFIINAKYKTYNQEFSIATKANAGAWTLKNPVTGPTSAVELSGSVAFNHHNNSLNGAYCDMDTVLDPGETSLMTVTLANVGSGAVSGITAQVTSPADVTFANEGIIEFADSASARESMSAALEVTLNTATTNEPIDIVVTFSSDDADLVLPAPITTTMNVDIDYENTQASENFANTDTVWLDWQRNGQWNISNGAMVGENLAQQADTSLISPTVTVSDSGDFSMAFAHSFAFEAGSDGSPWDGGVIEVSINGGDWTDVTDETVGGSFTTGYNGTILPSNPALGGRDGFVTTAVTSSETITFADGLLNGKTAQFRFRIGSDETTGAAGWTIDDVSFTNITNPTPFSALVADSGVCSNRAPLLVDVTGPASAASATAVTLTAQGLDHDADNLNYSWTQTAGTTSINTYTTNATLTFDAPAVEVDESYTFSVVASDGELSSDAQAVSVIVTASVVEETTETNSSSGASMGLFTLLLAPLCFLRRRKRG